MQVSIWEGIAHCFNPFDVLKDETESIATQWCHHAAGTQSRRSFPYVELDLSGVDHGCCEGLGHACLGMLALGVRLIGYALQLFLFPLLTLVVGLYGGCTRQGELGFALLFFYPLVIALKIAAAFLELLLCPVLNLCCRSSTPMPVVVNEPSSPSITHEQEEEPPDLESGIDDFMGVVRQQATAQASMAQVLSPENVRGLPLREARILSP